MSRRITLLLSLCFFVCASCASQPQPVPRGGYDSVEDDEVERQEEAPRADEQVAPREDHSAAQQGPIDLGLGDSDSSATSIVINRPNNAAADMEDPADTSRTYDRVCKVVEDCEGLPEPSCDGEMACASAQCAYTCDSDGAQDSDDFEEDVEVDDFAD